MVIEECEFNGLNGKCNVCRNVALTSKALLKEHIQGKKHNREIDKLEKAGNTVRRFSLQDNSVQDSAVSSLELSSTSKMIKDADIKLYSMRGIDLDGNGRGKCRVCDIEFYSLDQARDHYNNDKSRHNSLNQPSFNEHLSEGIEMSGNSGKCTLCDVNLTSIRNAQQHGQGHNHQKKLRRRQTQSDDPDPILKFGNQIIFDENLCYICEVAFTSKATKSAHLEGQQHGKCFKILQKGMSLQMPQSPPSYEAIN